MKKILVVDDEEAIRLLYKEELSEAGYHVDVAQDGAAFAVQRRSVGTFKGVNRIHSLPGVQPSSK